VALADDFQRVIDSLPPDWTHAHLDLRIFDESNYIEAATLLSQVNAMPYSKHDWHWRLDVAREFGHHAAAETVNGTLRLLDDAEIEGQLVLRGARSGRVEVEPMWGRPESVRQEFRRRRVQ
jgi:hypothetical protein